MSKKQITQLNVDSINDSKKNKVIDYIENYLASKHPFRSGPVCPFVPAALKKNSIKYFHLDVLDVDETINLVSGLLKKYLLFRGAKDNGVTSFVIVLDEKFLIENLRVVHYFCKPSFIESHVMIGATNPTNNAPSLHAVDYYPLRTPLPCLIFRELTIHDLAFLDPVEYSVDQRIRFLESFISKFSSKPGESVQKQVGYAKGLLESYTEK